METKDLIPDEFFLKLKLRRIAKRFKDLQKCGIEKMLEGELEAHLDYDRND